MKTKSELLYSYLTQPRAAIRYVIDHPSHTFIFCVFLFALANMHVTSALVHGVGGNAAGFYLTFGYTLKVVSTFLLVLIMISLIHFGADLWGTTGSISALLGLFLFSFTPFIFMTSVILVSKSAYWLSLIGFGLWTALLQIKGIQEIYRLSAYRALITFLFPFFILIFLVPLVLVLSFLFALFLLFM